MDPSITWSDYRKDPFALYEASVQAPDINLLFAEKTYVALFERAPKALREDFCGTARLACEWASWGEDHRAWGVDLHRVTLDWGREHHLAALGETAGRVELVEGDVRHEHTPPVDITAAFNFSYFIFKQRPVLLDYFRHVYAGLKPDGLFVMDLFGGYGAGEVGVEKRAVDFKIGPDGLPLPRFTYFWDQAGYNPLNHHLLCHIHFKLNDGTRLNKAYTYDWRLWTLPELRDLLHEAGFEEALVYTHGWDDDGSSDDVYQQRDTFDNEPSWLAYLVGVKRSGPGRK